MTARKADKPAKLPKGSKLSLVQTQGLNPGDYPLYDLRGLTAGKVQLLVGLLKGDRVIIWGQSSGTLAADILKAITNSGLEGKINE